MKTLYPLRLIACTLFLASCATSKTGTIEIIKGEESTANPALTATIYGGEELAYGDLYLARLEINVTLTAGFAESHMEMEFINPGDEELEAELLLDLPTDSIVTGYALDIQGVMVPGVLAPEPRVRKVYEENVRQAIDPGIAEITRNNAFRNTVYPVPQKGSRTIRLKFVTPVENNKQYRLPLNISQPVGHFSLKVDQSHTQNAATVEVPESLSSKIIDASGVSTTSGRNVRLNGNLVIQPNNRPTHWLEQRPDGKRFAYFRVPVEDLIQPAVDSRSVRLYWDTSLSNAGSKYNELEFLERYLTDLPNDSLELIQFTHSDNALKTHLKVNHLNTAMDTRFHGGSGMKALFNNESKRPPVDQCILVSDGRVTLGGMPEHQLPCPLLTLTASKHADGRLLGRLARLNRGRYLNLNAVDSEVALTQPVSALESIKIDGENRVNDAIWLTSDRQFILVLPVTKKDLIATLVFGNGKTRSFSLNNTPTVGNALGAWWASQKINDLHAQGTSQNERLAFLREHSVATEEAAFVVFDLIDDYVELDLPPPDLTAEEFHQLDWENYESLVEEFAEYEKTSPEEFEADLIKKWRERVAWYESSFSGPPPKETPPPAEPTSQDTDHRTRPERVRLTAGFSGNEDDLEEVLVTGSRIPPQGPQITFTVTPWSPDRPYLRRLEGLCRGEFRETYFELIDGYGEKPAFFYEVADKAIECGDRSFALDILLSALESPLANEESVVAVGRRLIDYGFAELSIDLFTRMSQLDPSRPQPWRDLAMAYVSLAKQPGVNFSEKTAALQQALVLYQHLLRTQWASSYDGIELISIMEANAIVSEMSKYGIEDTVFDKRFVYPMELDLRLVVTWNRDSVDLDLHVLEPHGERVSYKNTLSNWGGSLSNDMTDGYGPEEYVMRMAQQGKYEALMDYFSEDILNPNGPVVARIDIFRNWGRENQVHSQTKVEFVSDDQEERSLVKIEVR